MSAKTKFAALVAVFLVAVVSGCGSGGSSSISATSKTLTIPFGADMGVPDPAQFYAVEGLLVTNNVYEGLLRFKPGTAKATLEPALATSWKVSPDGLTYTFQLRKGVTFHDGTPMDAKSVVASFERFINVEGGPSYMLAEVKKLSAPSPRTVVIELKKPVSPMLDYLAAPYGPKVLSATALAKHDEGEEAEKWLSTHDAGTGPYTISAWKVGQEYVLSSYPKYWGGAPHFTTVRIPIIANFATQRLELQNGGVNMLLSGVPKSDAESLASSGFQVQNLPSDNKAVLLANPNTGVLAPKPMREALFEAVNRKGLVENVFGSAAKVSTSVYPEGTFPPSLAPDDPPYEPAKLQSLLAKAGDKKAVLEYPAEGGAVTARLAEELQVQLQAAGLEVTLRATPYSELFTLAEHPSKRPDMLVLIAPPDTANPDAWVRLLSYSTSPVNYLGCTVPGLDEAIDAGLNSPTPQQATKEYAKAGELVTGSACSLGLANVEDTIVAQPGITGISHTVAVPGVIDLAALGEK